VRTNPDLGKEEGKGETVRVVAIIMGLAGLWLVGQDAFETVILPRRVTRQFRFSRLFYRVARRAWQVLGRRLPPGPGREVYLGYFGPLSLLALFASWAALFFVAFALLLWGLAVPLIAPEKTATFATYLYLSGETFFTLGLGDVSPVPGPARFLIVAEVAFGFSFLALVVAYVPVLYQAFSRRELRISLLDARAGSPASAAEILRRNCAGKNPAEITALLRDWEVWCADILESHLSYPVLSFYRSQHEGQSWVGALTVMLDACALLLAGIEEIPAGVARFTFAIARHTAVDLSQIFDTMPSAGIDRLPAADFCRVQEALAAAGLHFEDGVAAERRLTEIRRTYEPFVLALAHYLLVTLPPWIVTDGQLDDWQTSAWDDLLPLSRQVLIDIMRPRSQR
jgi:hypothetical protein